MRAPRGENGANHVRLNVGTVAFDQGHDASDEMCGHGGSGHAPRSAEVRVSGRPNVPTRRIQIHATSSVAVGRNDSVVVVSSDVKCGVCAAWAVKAPILTSVARRHHHNNAVGRDMVHCVIPQGACSTADAHLIDCMSLEVSVLNVDVRVKDVDVGARPSVWIAGFPLECVVK